MVNIYKNYRERGFIEIHKLTALPLVSQAQDAAPATKPTGRPMPDWIKPPTYDCRTCHAIDKKVIGPAWQDVANRYKGDPAAKTMLLEKVRKGGKGNWTAVTGGVPMVAHPKLTDEEIMKAIDFEQSLYTGK
jgi:cytochrome c